MNILTLLAGFAGGFFGAAYGSIPAFILTGVFALIGSVLTLAGVTDFTVGNIAFGPFFGPHVSFAAGAAAATYAANKAKKLDDAQNVLAALFGLNDINTLLVGGLYGLVGIICFTLITKQTAFVTDYPAFCVCVVLFLNRIILGKTSLIGTLKEGEKREILPQQDAIMNGSVGLLFGLGIAILGKLLMDAGVSKESMGIYPVFTFGFSAISLAFLQMGFSVPITHHITYPAATVFVMTGNVYLAALTGLINALLWVMAGKIFNSHCDTYIDPPAIVIAVSMFVINLIF
ncbi:hypothetical protein KQI68_07945 [Peptoniphilus sp. MSJ-1]|uniref:DUF7973 domain-containing protein n=1 Tax=Peptoniphilus ovalis TaxID=2841503 RepID=A0ABS6FKP4_9FIRM|nr:hypothetical protein [Peptoniphilus ovalis]MBU5669765.1 hypothetical protein [Peptoniphilus ovalis]